MNAHAIPWKRPRTTKHATDNRGNGHAFDEDLLCRFCCRAWAQVTGEPCRPAPEAVEEHKRYAHALASKRAREKARSRKRRHTALVAQTWPS